MSKLLRSSGCGSADLAATIDKVVAAVRFDEAPKKPGRPSGRNQEVKLLAACLKEYRDTGPDSKAAKDARLIHEKAERERARTYSLDQYILKRKQRAEDVTRGHHVSDTWIFSVSQLVNKLQVKLTACGTAAEKAAHLETFYQSLLLSQESSLPCICE